MFENHGNFHFFLEFSVGRRRGRGVSASHFDVFRRTFGGGYREEERADRKHRDGNTTNRGLTVSII